MIIASDITNHYPFNEVANTSLVKTFESEELTSGNKPLWTINLTINRTDNTTTLKIYRSVWLRKGWTNQVKFDGDVSDIKDLPVLFRLVGITK